MGFDLVIAGGEVVDPGSGLAGRMDVGIRDGVIAAVDRGLATDDVGARLDATGQIVTQEAHPMHLPVSTISSMRKSTALNPPRFSSVRQA